MTKYKNKTAKWLLPALLCGLIALCLGALHMLSRAPAVPGQTAAPTPAAQKTLLAINGSDVASIEILTPRDETYTLTHENGQLLYQGAVIRSVIAENLLSAVCTVIAEDTVLDLTGQVTDLSSFGLSPARCSARVTLNSGSVHTLLLGDTLPIGIPYRYLMIDGQPTIYAVSADLYEWFSYAPGALLPVEQPVWNAEFWDQAVLTGENERCLTHTAWGWMLNTPFTYPADTQAVQSFLEACADIAFAAYVGEADALDLARYGLDAPRLTLTLHQSATTADYYDVEGALTHSVQLPEEDIVLTFGDELDSDYVYCMYLDKVYTATRFQTAFLWDTDHLSLCDPTPLDVPVSALESLTCTWGNETPTYCITLTEQLERNGELKTDEDSQVLYDVTVTKDGQAMDADVFVAWLMNLQHLSPQSAVPSTFDADASVPIMTLTFEGHSLARTVRIVRLDALHLALEVEGQALFYAPESTFQDVLTLP